MLQVLIASSVLRSVRQTEIGDQNYYRQFAELSWKNQNLLKAVWRPEVQLIGLLKISSATLLFISHCCASTALKILNRFINFKVKKILGSLLIQSFSKLFITSAGCWNEICTGGEWCSLLWLIVQGNILSLYKMNWKRWLSATILIHIFSKYGEVKNFSVYSQLHNGRIGP